MTPSVVTLLQRAFRCAHERDTRRKAVAGRESKTRIPQRAVDKALWAFGRFIGENVFPYGQLR